MNDPHERPGEDGYFAALYRVDVSEPEEGAPSAGISSSTSSPSPETTTGPGSASRRKPARTTANP